MPMPLQAASRTPPPPARQAGERASERRMFTSPGSLSHARGEVASPFTAPSPASWSPAESANPGARPKTPRVAPCSNAAIARAFAATQGPRSRGQFLRPDGALAAPVAQGGLAEAASSTAQEEKGPSLAGNCAQRRAPKLFIYLAHIEL
ncbi:unnamed protein product [Lampetra fluviatilis]